MIRRVDLRGMAAPYPDDRAPDYRRLVPRAEFDVEAGATVPFVMTQGPSHLAPPDPIDPLAALDGTVAFWTEWTARSRSTGEWADVVDHVDLANRPRTTVAVRRSGSPT